MIPADEEAPVFVLKDTDNKEISLLDLRGKFVLLLFYPRDNTRVCTVQMCEYRDNWQSIQRLGIEVLAINPASKDTHNGFKNSNGLPFPILSDEDSSVEKKYGVQNIFGITKRAYVLISPSGKILYSKSHSLSLFYTSAEDLTAIIREKIRQYQLAAETEIKTL